MDETQTKQLCLDLLHAETENEVIEILTRAGFWNNPNAWRLYGDKEGNFAQAGNQQALPEAALVEKIVNCCDSRLMAECLKRGINAESEDAPKNVRDAVALFFENRRAENDEAGTLRNWSTEKRTQQARFITAAATGGRPTRGQRTTKMCLTIADQGEGQRVQQGFRRLFSRSMPRTNNASGSFRVSSTWADREHCVSAARWACS